MANREIIERRQLRLELDRLCIDMDLDALRFTVCVACLRTMTADELERFQERMNKEIKRREQHKARGPKKPR